MFSKNNAPIVNNYEGKNKNILVLEQALINHVEKSINVFSQFIEILVRKSVHNGLKDYFGKHNQQDEYTQYNINDMLTKKEAAKELDCTIHNICYLQATNKIAYKKINGRVLFLLSDVLAYKEKRRIRKMKKHTDNERLI